MKSDVFWRIYNSWFGVYLIAIAIFPKKSPVYLGILPVIPLILPALTWYTILIPAGQVVDQVWHLVDRCQRSGIIGQGLVVPVESGIHLEFHQMLSDGDVSRWWLLSKEEWFEIIIFFLTAPAALTLPTVTKSKYEIWWRLRASPSRYVIWNRKTSLCIAARWRCQWRRVVAIRSLECFWKNNYFLYIVEIWNHMTWEVDSKFLKPTETFQ